MPRAGSPVVDGTVAPREWKCAHRIAQGTAALLASYDGRHAYLGVGAPSYAITSVFVARDERLTILHASAAIGDASYRRIPGTAGSAAEWQIESKFEWTRYRDAGDLVARGGTFLQAHGWLASHRGMGAAGDTEITIDAALVKDARVAITYYDPEARMRLLTYPADLSGDAVGHEIQAGFNPAALRIDTTGWARVKLAP